MGLWFASNRKKKERQRSLRFESLESRQVLAASPLVPLAGDWDGDGATSVGVYDRAAGTFYLRNDNSAGFADVAVRFGPQGAANITPVVGDWNGDGIDTPGYYDTVAGKVFLKNNLSAGAADIVFSYGPKNSTYMPIVGDWDGNGSESLGLYDRAAGKVFLRNALTSGPAQVTFGFGPKNQVWVPLAGDWDGNNVDTIALYRRADGTFFLRNAHAAGAADSTFVFGPAGDIQRPLAGDWDGNGTVTVGLWDPATGKFTLRNSLTSGAADAEFYVSPLLDPTAVVSGAPPVGAFPVGSASTVLDDTEVQALLKRAAAASASNDAIIAIVDRGGRILGVRVESAVSAALQSDPELLAFAIDGAVAKARTAAFFSNNQAPLTSRTVRFISQTTITEREVESNPNSLNQSIRGPGFVAPVGLGGHFPPEIMHTPPVDLFAIEHTNRDGIVHPGANHVRQTVTLNPDGSVASTSGDDILLEARFNVDPAYIPFDLDDWLTPPESYGFVSGSYPEAQSRGIATLPGGIPLYKNGYLVGGIGVFFPGPDGYATFEQGFVPGINQTEEQRTNAPKALEAEWIAFAAAGGSSGAGASVGTLNGVPPVAGFNLPFGRIDLVGITLEIYGPHPGGVNTVLAVGASVGVGNPNSGADKPVTVSGSLYLEGEVVPEGWLVLPHASPTGDLTAAQVSTMISTGIVQANLTRAAIRLPLGSRTSMVFAVSDTHGNVLGLYRMPDSTVFSLDVAVAKARNVSYYDDPTALQPADRVDASVPPNGTPDLPVGVAMTNRTFRFLAEARYPSGVDGAPPGPFSILFDPGNNPATAENTGLPAAAASQTSVLGFDAFNPATNFRDPSDIANQNGVVFFPGAAPVYTSGVLRGGLGVSGDGVDQDDVVTFFAAQGFLPPDAFRADQYFVRGVRLPFMKFNRNPEA